MLERHFNTVDRKSLRAPTRLYAGRGAAFDLPDLLPKGPSIMVVDQVFACSDVARTLRPAVTLSVSGEPNIRDTRSLIELCAGSNAVAVVALGGGSTIDTAKAIHSALCFAGSFPRDVERPAGAPALVTVPTTAGSGSETSRFFILSDDTGVKCSHRAWSFAPDLAVLDPALLEASGDERLVLGAFDAFVHLWETFICRNERAPFVDMLAREGIGLIADAMTALASCKQLDDAQLMGLQRASAYGGFAISNVRTGLIHTLGESLAAQVPLSHPETLYVFYRAALDQYRTAIGADLARLDRHLRASLAHDFDFERLDAVWHHLFEHLGVAARIEARLAASAIDAAKLLATASRDVVLAKENPALLTPAILDELIARRLAQTSKAALRSA